MANEKRLIDANALKSKIQEYHNSLKPQYISKLVDAEIADIQDIIDKQPTVDAVEAVRCSACVSCKVIIDNVGAGHCHCKKRYGQTQTASGR